jgi:lysophospholipase L1-like esterase
VWSDHIHPNDLGYQRIAERLAPVLEGLLAR